MAKKIETIETPEIETPAEEIITPPTIHTVEAGDIRAKSSFGRTFYYIDQSRDQASKGPNQLKGIIRWMLENGITSERTALQGAEIGRRAVADKFVTTEKLSGEVIFAYYIRRMEREFGVEHAKTIHAKTGKRMN